MAWPIQLSSTGVIFVAFTSPFVEKAAAMQLVSEWAAANYHNHSFTTCTNSQSPLKATECRSPATHLLRSFLKARLGPTTRLWVLGHKGIPSNELADTESETAATTTSDSYASARSLIRRTLIDPPSANSRTAPSNWSHFSAESLCQSPRLLRRPTVPSLGRGAADK